MRTRKSVPATPALGGDPHHGEIDRPDDSDLAHLMTATDWTATRALEAIFEAAPESIAVYDTQGRIVRANATFHASLDRVIPGDRPARRWRAE
jgi:PAS domain-containing protein